MSKKKTIMVYDMMFRDARGRVWVFTLIKDTGQVISKSIDQVTCLDPLPSLEEFLAKNHYCLLGDTITPYWNVAPDKAACFMAGLERH